MEKSASGSLVKTPVRDRNLKWLHDDYVKFIRFAQMKMDASDEGVVGIITNHAYLDNPTFPGMRNSLMRSFDQIWIVDLHGSTKPKETPPDGAQNENVFDIKKGVAITFFVKKSGAEKGVWRTDMWGSRIEKYKMAASANLSDLLWTKLNPQSPDYLFVVQDGGLKEDYERNFSVVDIFWQQSVGIVTARDSLTIHFDKKPLLSTVREFSESSIEVAREKFNLGKDVRDWKVEWAQKDLAEHKLSPAKAIQVLYRPFDPRWTYYTGASRGFHCYPRHDVMRHLLKENIALVTSRMTKGEQFAHVQVTDKPAEVICMSSETSNNGFIFPLYLYAPPAGKKLSLPGLGPEDLFQGKGEIENISSSFRVWIDKKYKKSVAVEKIFGFIYAVLHSQTYRNKYGEFLRREFPRIPFPNKCRDFDDIARLGWDLAQTHLLKDVPSLGLAKYIGTGNHKVDSPRYVEEEQSIYINKIQKFTPITPEVWKFQVGGYTVLEKYLKSRKGRTLTLGEINNITNVANVLAFTGEQMRRTDKAYQAAF
jgi:predicted helicase